jgi:hypothetical protein
LFSKYRKGDMKMQNLICLILAALLFGCGKPLPVQVKDVCSQPEGTNVITQGYLSLPNFMERMSYRKGNNVSVSYTLFLMTKPDATGESVRALLWGSHEGKPNKIKPIPEKYTWNDLLIYTDDGKMLGAGAPVKLTGTTQKNDKGNCDINVTKIENP